MSEFDTNSWANRKAANNDGMDPDWRPSEFRADASPKTHVEPIAPQDHVEEIDYETQPPQFIPKSDYESLRMKYHSLNEDFRKLRMEIDTRWEPSLKKAQHKANVFQQELMDKHEEMVTRIDAIDKVLDYERKRADGNFKTAQELEKKAADAEKGRVIAMQALHQSDEREVKLVEQVSSLRKDHEERCKPIISDLKSDVHRLENQIKLHMAESQLLWNALECRDETLEPIGKEAADLEERAANIRAQWGGK